MRTVRTGDTGCCRIIANSNNGNLEKLLEKLNIKIGTSFLKKITLYKGIRRYTLFSSDLVTTKDKDWVVNNIFAGLIMRVGKEFILYLLGWSLSQVPSQG